jgi:hypothetical protein
VQVFVLPALPLYWFAGVGDWRQYRSTSSSTGSHRESFDATLYNTLTLNIVKTYTANIIINKILYICTNWLKTYKIAYWYCGDSKIEIRSIIVSFFKFVCINKRIFKTIYYAILNNILMKEFYGVITSFRSRITILWCNIYLW